MTSKHLNHRLAFTQNKMGYSILDLNPCSQAFIDFSTQGTGPVLDIGCAFGVATIPCLEKGAQVIANDLSSNHLSDLKRKAPQRFLKNLTLRSGDIREISFAENSLLAIHGSQVFHFFTGEEMEKLIQKLYRVLIPGGKIFIIVGTPYVKMLESFLPLYEKRKEQGEKWPGELNDFPNFCPEDVAGNVPSFIHFLEKETLGKAFEEGGFHIEQLYYYDRPGLPPHIQLDGRENAALIASKPPL